MQIDLEHNICQDKFWDINLAWYSAIPDFTQCFQQIIFILVPCSIFSIIGIIALLRRLKLAAIHYCPWTALYVLKMVIILILILASIVEISLATRQKVVGESIPNILIYSSCVKLISYVMAFFTLIQNRKVDIRSSTLLSLYWFCLTICWAFRYRSSFLSKFDEIHVHSAQYQFIINMIEYPLIVISFICSLFNDPSSSMDKSFLEDSPFFSLATFFWFYKYIRMSTKKLLTLEDFQPLDITLKADYLWKKFEPNLSKALLKIKSSNKSPDKFTFLLSFVVTKSVLPYFLLGCLFQLAYDFFVFFPPLVLNEILIFLSLDEFEWKGYIYGVALFLSCSIGHITFTFMMFYSALFAHQVKSIFISAVYRKSLRLSTTARREYTSGEIINLMSVDVNNTYMLALYSNLIFGAPIKLCFVVALLWKYLGPACLAGGVVIIIMMVVGLYISSKTEKIQAKQMKMKDSRIKLMSEILNGIKILKMYVWELPFMDKITNIRIKEVRLIRTFQLLFASSILVFHTGPLFVCFASFVTYIFTSATHMFDVRAIFVSINLIKVLQFTVLEIPDVITKIAQTRVSLGRLLKFLTADEQNEDAVGNIASPGEAISVQNATFSWTDDAEPTLKNINFQVKTGSLVAVVGAVGSGKSSLLSAILGEMPKLSGSININGKIAFVQQQAWVMNRTLRENIYFVNTPNKSMYNAVLDDCCLRMDLEALPAGDKTEIGEKGVNLSGGQKQRVSVARAVIHDADIYLLDDPLSAVDAHVGKHMFQYVISNEGLLKNKTRILITHNINVLPETDYIFTIKNGEICESGTYNELLQNGGHFADFIEEHSNITNEKAITDGYEIGDNEEIDSKDGLAKLSRNISVASTSSADAKLIEDEGIVVGKVKGKVFINYAKHMNIVIVMIYLAGVIGFVSCDISCDLWLSKWTADKPLPDGSIDYSKRNLRIAIFLVLIIGKTLLTALAATCLALGSARAAKLYHWEMLQSIMRAPMSFFDTTPLGRILNRFSQDIDDVDMQISTHIDSYVACTVYSIGTCILIGSTTPLFFAFLIPIIVLYYIIQKYYLLTSRHLKRLMSTSVSPIFSHFTETVDGLSSIKAYKVEEQFKKKLEDKINTNVMCQLYYFMSTRWLEFNIGLLGDIIVLLSALLSISSKDLAEGLIALSITYALTITEDLTWIVYSGTELENKFVSVERIEEYSNVTSEAPWTISESFPPSSWPSLGKVKLQDYSTRYREGLDLVLKGINLDINENEKVGIVGRTGAGKSSFTLALFRIIESADGAILIDDVDISEIGLHQLRSKLTIIPQDPTLFTGPLRLNLDPSNDHSDDEIWSSLENAHLKDFVSSLSEGLNYEVAEKGENLSVGQRQLLCLARALLKKTKILILDEATAAVDMDTDRLIQNTIRTEFKNYTIITIAHRLNTIMDYDKIVVMDAGEVKEVGKPSELLQSPNSQFYNMAKDAGVL